MHRPFRNHCRLRYEMCYFCGLASLSGARRLGVRVNATRLFVQARGGGADLCQHDRSKAALASATGVRAAAEDLATAQLRLTNNLRERTGGGVCL